MQLRLLGTICTVAVVCAVSALATAGVARSSPTGAASKYLVPTTVSRACQRDTQRRSACELIRRFFRAMNSREFANACTLLGKRLRSETYGMTCRRFLALGMPEAMPWGILGAQRAGTGASILVTLGQSELDHVRMRHHRAYVDVEGGRLRILDTQLVR